MVSTKKLREEIKFGNIEKFEIFEQIDRTATIYFNLRNGIFDYRLNREFVSITSALKYLIRLLDKTVIEGLTSHHMAPPAIIVRKTKRRKGNETSQSEPPKKQENFQ